MYDISIEICCCYYNAKCTYHHRTLYHGLGLPVIKVTKIIHFVTTLVLLFFIWLLLFVFFFLFKGAHVTITARSSDDVEESVVLEKVKSASGINFHC